MIKEMLATDDLAEYLRIHKNQIYRLIKQRMLLTRMGGYEVREPGKSMYEAESRCPIFWNVISSTR
jgi:hypothetical protein